jgi:hypothetical protein
MKILFTIYFALATNIIAADYSSEISSKEIYKFSFNTTDGYSTEIRKTEGTWTDSLGNYGLNTSVGNIIKEKEKLNLDLMCKYIDQEKQKNWSKLFRKKTINDSVIGVVEYIEATDKYKVSVRKKCNYAAKFYDSSFFFFKHKCNE